MLYGFADDAGLSVLASDSNEVVFRSELLNLQLLHLRLLVVRKKVAVVEGGDALG